MQINSIPSCCAGLQIKDFPGAHHEGNKTDKATVLELLRLMFTNRHNSFFVAWANLPQNVQMEGIFKDLGWKKHECGIRVVNYLLPGPRDWFNKQGFHSYTKANITKISPVWAKATQEYYEKLNLVAETAMKNALPRRKKFFALLEKKYAISKEELAFLGKF